MNKRDTTPYSYLPPRQTLSVTEVAQILGFEQTTVYRLIWRGKLRICAGTARYRVPEAEIERFLASTETHVERVSSRPKMRRAERRRNNTRVLGVHPSHNADMIFVPLVSFGRRPIGGRLMKTVVRDDDFSVPETFVEVNKIEWAAETVW